MSEEDLQLLVTIDDPWYGPDEDIFHLKTGGDVTYWPGQHSVTAEREDHRAQASQ